MKVFSGFPSGKLTVTPLPNLFFTELLPAIENLAELKTTIHVYWLVANSKTRFVRSSELLTDKTLMQSLAINGNKAEDELERSLDAAVTRGTLVKLSDQDDFYFVNNDAGRRALEKMEKEKLPRRSTVESADVRERPNIFTLYEQNVGLLTPMIAEELKEAEKEYPAEWTEDAFKIAVENNVRKWSYIKKILARWQTEGRPGDSKKRTAWWEGEHAKHINR